MFELIPDGIIAIGIVVFAFVIGLIVRRKNNEYLKLETKLEQRKQLLRLGKPPTPNSPVHHHLPSVEGKTSRFQSSEQHRERETTRIKHEPNQE